VNHRSTTTYIRRVLAGQSPVSESEQLNPRERALEVLVFALRRREGVDRKWFEAKSGKNLDSLLGQTLQSLVELKLLADDGRRICLTRNGLLVSDSICSQFLTASCVAA
jgi:oxygen-independent coproporphyrinogen-3 oxidase